MKLTARTLLATLALLLGAGPAVAQDADAATAPGAASVAAQATPEEQGFGEKRLGGELWRAPSSSSAFPASPTSARRPRPAERSEVELLAAEASSP